MAAPQRSQKKVDSLNIDKLKVTSDDKPKPAVDPLKVPLTIGNENEEKPLSKIDDMSDETLVLQLKCKLYRFNKDRNEWLERGNGVIRFMQHQINKICRLVLWEDGTRLLRLNHYLSSTTELTQFSGSEKSWLWAAQDFSDGEPGGVFHSFAVRFKTKMLAEEFEKMFILAKCQSEKAEGTRTVIEPQKVEEEDVKETVAFSGPKKEEQEKAVKPKAEVSEPFVFPRS